MIFHDIVMLVMSVIEWARKRTDGTVEYSIDGRVMHCERAFISWLNQSCIEYLSTLSGRIDAVKSRFGIRRLTPIPVSRELLYLPIRSLRSRNCLLINHLAIAGWKREGDKRVEIIFGSRSTIKVDSWRIFVRQREKGAIIEAYLNDILG
jgi:competence transcription factor ComK